MDRIEASTIRLSPREREVLAELVEGRTGRQISRILGIQPCTVEGYVLSLRQKFDAPSRVSLVGRAVRLGF